MYHAFRLENILSLNINLDKAPFYCNYEYDDDNILLLLSNEGTFLLISVCVPVLEKYVASFHACSLIFICTKISFCPDVFPLNTVL